MVKGLGQGQGQGRMSGAVDIRGSARGVQQKAIYPKVWSKGWSLPVGGFVFLSVIRGACVYNVADAISFLQDGQVSRRSRSKIPLYIV